MDRPGYLGAIQTFRSAGARLVGLGHHPCGHRRTRGTAAALPATETDLHNPTHHNPTGSHDADPSAARDAGAGQPATACRSSRTTPTASSRCRRRLRRRSSSSTRLTRSSSASTASRKCSRRGAAARVDQRRHGRSSTQLAMIKQAGRSAHTEPVATRRLRTRRARRPSTDIS